MTYRRCWIEVRSRCRTPITRLGRPRLLRDRRSPRSVDRLHGHYQREWARLKPRIWMVVTLGEKAAWAWLGQQFQRFPHLNAVTFELASECDDEGGHFAVPAIWAEIDELTYQASAGKLELARAAGVSDSEIDPALKREVDCGSEQSLSSLACQFVATLDPLTLSAVFGSDHGGRVERSLALSRVATVPAQLAASR